MKFRPMVAADLDSVWRIFHAITVEGLMLAHDENTTREEFESYWVGRGGEQWIAEDERIQGAFTLRANHPGRGAHIATATYLVAPEARGKGLGFALGQRSLVRARSLGFSGIQFNLVIRTNEVAVRLWHRLGFEVVGTMPRVFRHPDGTLVDALVMFRNLDGGSDE
jgi:L-amino acid N-acyltransferase YncA